VKRRGEWIMRGLDFLAIDHILLAMPKGGEKKAHDFFHGVLGFEVIEKPAELAKRGGLWFKFNHFELHLGVEEPFYPAKKAHPAFLVRELEALKEHLSNQGISYIEDEELPDAKRVFLEDPFGNRLEILERLHP
jgi:catechol 2,3-dioxygenase-like lactoylglutathione lyase family enzyme